MIERASSQNTKMKAIVRREYGSPDVLDVEEIDVPVIEDGEVLVRVHAVSVNPVDWHTLTGWPYLVRLQGGLRRPKDPQLGVDYAGTVVEVGGAVTRFRPGDEVFGCRNGAFAEYVRAREERAIVGKPANLSFEDAAAVGVAGLTALQGLRDKGHLQQGQKVLVNGASGGVGTYAVQIAKALGAEVTGVCSTRNVELVRSLGADHVVDYTREDFTRQDRRYDLLLDIAGGRSWSECKSVLRPEATLVQVGGPKRNRFTGISLVSVAAPRLGALFGSRDVTMFLAKTNKEDLTFLLDLLEAGKLTSAIDRRYDGLAEVPEALAYLGEGHARAKVVVTFAVD
ncbi:MAG TPA: NAD(P)-dependent alcohol dehydrogenase [Gaiellaceae bacterium]|nr:NAD(P)-dependent alcohol dehydrogenase [Gaiellaceae bacterium]